ncbi:MAG: hypothetical protein WCZ90_11195 [Melioribacteraceae bacterium]
MIVTINTTLVHGTRSVFHNMKIVILMWVINAASALVLTVPIYNLLVTNLSHSAISDKLMENFDYMWFLQFRHLYQIQLDQIPLSIYSMVVIYILLQTFFLGGLISIFNTPEKNHIVDFFFGGVRFFFRFLKVLLISLVFYALAIKIYDWLGLLITSGYQDSENVWMDFVLKGLRYILLIFMLGVVTLLSDYSKVSLAVNDKTKFFKEFYNAILFIKDHFSKVFTVFLIVAIIGALGVLVYNIIGKFIPRTPSYFLVLSFVLQQMLIIFRLLIRMLFCSTEVILYKDLSAEEVLVEIH